MADPTRAALAVSPSSEIGGLMTLAPFVSESICQACGGPNVVWFAPNDVWNRVMPDDGGIVCPACFALEAARKGLDVRWRFAPEPDASPSAEIEGLLDRYDREWREGSYLSDERRAAMRAPILRYVGTLTARAAEAERDAERLDFLEELTSEECDHMAPTTIYRDHEYAGAFALCGLDIPNVRANTLRDAIDAAREEAHNG